MNINNAPKSGVIKKALTDFLKNPGKGLYQRAVRSGIWVFGLSIFERALSVVKLVVLARILAPNDFGLMGIALLAMTCLETSSQTGLQQALIQKKEGTEKYLDVAWTFLLIRNLAIFALLFIGAPYIAKFFDAPKVTPIMRIIGIFLLFGGPSGIGGFANIGVLYFQKELEFNKQFIYRLSGTLADFAISVTAAIVLKSVWALVFGLLAGNIARFFVGYKIHPYRPRLNFDFDKAHELFRFGRWVLASNILVSLVTQGDNIVVGKLLGATLLGFYQMAHKFSNAPAREITQVISQVTFPAYSKLQDNPEGLRQAYLKTLQLTAFISIPLAGGIFILAPEFTRIFLGDKWMPMVPAMQVLALVGLVGSIQATTGPIFRAVGRPNIDTKWQVVRLIVLATTIYPLTLLWGMLGASIAVLASIFVTFLGCSVMVIKVTGCDIRSYNKVVACPLVAGLFMVAVIFVLKGKVNTVGLWFFVLFVLLGFLVYVGFIYILDKFLHYGAWLLVKRSFDSLRDVE